MKPSLKQTLKKKIKRCRRLHKVLVSVKQGMLVMKTGCVEAMRMQPSPQDKRTYEGIVTSAELKRDLCCGCSACANACPVNAINMVRGEDGFINPIVDAEKCVRCKKCVSVCPVLHVPKGNRSDPDCYALMAPDEIRMESSSGGAFTLLANAVLEEGGFVCGVTLDDNFAARHVVIHEKQELAGLRRSKYVQAIPGDIYRQVKSMLKERKKVLFSGTPCQVAALRNYLGKEDEKLILVDIVCHGAPSAMVFERYLQETFGDQLANFHFRTKRSGYNCMNQIAYLKDGSEEIRNVSFDAYEQCMHSGLSIRSICGDCPFAPAPRQGDVTIGDFWGISSYNPDLNDGLGTSVLLVNNERGKRIFEAIRPQAKLTAEVPFEVARRNNRFGSLMRTPQGRNSFYEMLKTQPFEKAVHYALREKYDVGVIGLWYGRNYGSIATYYGLNYRLKQMGLSVLMIENCLKSAAEDDMAKMHPNRFASQHYHISKQYALDDLYMLNSCCDSFIVGSDQLWNHGLSRPYKQTYFLDFVAPYRKRISYSTSFGKRYRGTWGEKEASIRNLKKFDHISVRDSFSLENCEEFGLQATQVCDPVLFCPKEEYARLGAQSNLKVDEKYILAYILDPTEEMGRLLHKIAQHHKCKVYVILDMLSAKWENNRKRLNVDAYADVVVKSEVDFNEWLYYFDHATSVITDSFHGTLFAIIFRKTFLVRCNYARGPERFTSLLIPFGLEKQLYDSIEQLEANMDMLAANVLDYVEADAKIARIVEESGKWLEHALFSSKVVAQDPYCIYQSENAE